MDLISLIYYANENNKIKSSINISASTVFPAWYKLSYKLTIYIATGIYIFEILVITVKTLFIYIKNDSYVDQ